MKLSFYLFGIPAKWDHERQALAPFKKSPYNKIVKLFTTASYAYMLLILIGQIQVFRVSQKEMGTATVIFSLATTLLILVTFLLREFLKTPVFKNILSLFNALLRYEERLGKFLNSYFY